MQPTARAAILIDADNLQDETWLEAVLREQVRQRAGCLPVIRACGRHRKRLSRVPVVSDRADGKRGLKAASDWASAAE